MYAKLLVFGPAGYMLGPAGYMVVAHVILVSVLVQILLFSFFEGLLFNLGICWDMDLDQDLDQGLTIDTPRPTMILVLF